MSVGALAGVLIWAKMRLVTNIPRSAYAEPERAQSDPDDPAGRSGSEAEDTDARFADPAPLDND